MPIRAFRGCNLHGRIVANMDTWRFFRPLVEDTVDLKRSIATALALVGQPWSYLRLKAYSFFWLCEGGIECIWRLGAERLHTGPISLIDTLPRPRASPEPIA